MLSNFNVRDLTREYDAVESIKLVYQAIALHSGGLTRVHGPGRLTMTTKASFIWPERNMIEVKNIK